MQDAIILHGKANQAKYHDPAFPSPSNASWLPWLQKQLLIHGILAQTPEMPAPWRPVYSAWSKEFERFDVTPQTMLVAHSCGAGFLVRWLSEHRKVRVGKVVLVAPWIDPDRSGGMGDFFDFAFDPNLSNRTAKLVIFNSTDDFPGAQESAHIISDTVRGVTVRNFTCGHFVKMNEFPELYEALIG